MKMFKNKFAIGGLVIVLAAIGWYSYSKSKATSAPVRYVTAKVIKGTLTSSVNGTGQVSVLNQLDIKPQGSGQVTSVRVKEGQQVKSGDIIATLDQQTAINQVNQARVSVAQAQAA